MLNNNVIEKKLKELIRRIKMLAVKYDFTLEPFLHIYSLDIKEKKKFHTELLELISNTIEDNKFLSDYKKFISHHGNDIVQSDDEFSALSIITQYLFDFAGTYFNIKNGQPIETNIYKFNNIEDVEEHRKKYSMRKNCDNEYALFIKPDGTVYFAPQGHGVLNDWLNLNEENMHSVVRISANNDLDLKSYYISSNDLWISEYTDGEDTSEELISLTYDQAEQIGKIHRIIGEMWGELMQLSQSLALSDNLGLGFYDNDTPTKEKNLYRLAKICEGFNVRDYQMEVNNRLNCDSM